MAMNLCREHTFAEGDREEFRARRKVLQWACEYALLFDCEDIRIALTQTRYHFFEWYVAIRLYEECGYLSLVEKYAYKVHARKRATFQSLVPASVFEFVTERKKHGYGQQAPDLLVYTPDGPIGSSAKSKG